MRKKDEVQEIQKVLATEFPNENIIKVFDTLFSKVLLTINVSRPLGKDISVFLMKGEGFKSIKHFKKGSLKKAEKHAVHVRDSIIAEEKRMVI